MVWGFLKRYIALHSKIFFLHTMVVKEWLFELLSVSLNQQGHSSLTSDLSSF